MADTPAHIWDLTEGEFPIGVDAQPAAGLAAWGRRGCNLAVRADLEGSAANLDRWLTAAAVAGLRTIRAPQSPANPATPETLLAWAQPDEADLSNHWYIKLANFAETSPGFIRYVWPDGKERQIRYWDRVQGDGGEYFLVGRDGPREGTVIPQTGANIKHTWEVYQIRAANWRAKNPSQDIFGNFAGNYITQNDPRENYAQLTKGVDWACNDWHVIDKDLTPPGQARRYQLWFPAWATSRLIDYSGGKLAGCYVECSNQRNGTNNPAKPWRWPTAAELRVIVWTAICHGAAFIIWFPQMFQPFRQDAISATLALNYNVTDEDVAAAQRTENAVIAINAEIKRFSKFLTGGGRRIITHDPVTWYTECQWALPGTGVLTVKVNPNPLALSLKSGGVVDTSGQPIPAYQVSIEAPDTPAGPDVAQLRQDVQALGGAVREFGAMAQDAHNQASAALAIVKAMADAFVKATTPVQ